MAGFNILTVFYFSATENAANSFVNLAAREIVALIPVAALYGMNGVWLSFPVSELIASEMSLYFYRHQKRAVWPRK